MKLLYIIAEPLLIVIGWSVMAIGCIFMSIGMSITNIADALHERSHST